MSALKRSLAPRFTRRVWGQFTLRVSVVLTLVALSPLIVRAHTLELDHAIGATFHADPADAPIAGQPSQLTFTVRRENGQPLGAPCTCTVSVVGADGRSVVANQLATTSSIDGSIYQSTVSFPAIGPYQVTLAGNPLDNSAFGPFTLAFPVQVVDPSVTHQILNSHWFHGLLIAVLFVTVTTLQRVKCRR